MPYINESIELVSAKEQPSKTYQIDFASGHITGFVDGLPAIEQSIYMILNTERFAHLIFSWDYGTEWDDVIGEPLLIAQSEIQRVIVEALLADDRIESVENFQFKKNDRQTIIAQFEVHTIFGTLAAQKEVSY